MATHPESLLTRAADGASLTDTERREMATHLESCAACREALEAQRLVAGLLHARADVSASPGFAGRVSARIDAEGAGILDLANWRAWTVGLVPVAAALALVAFLGVGTPVRDAGPAVTPTSSAPVTFENWASASAGSTSAAVFLQPSASGEQLLETVLTGVPASSGESSNVR